MARQSWKQPLPNLPYVKPTYKRGQDRETIRRISLPDQAPEKTKQFLVADKIITLKRSWFTAFDAAKAQDAAVAKAASALTASIETPSIEAPPPFNATRRDSIQDVSSSKLTETPKLLPVVSKGFVSPAPSENADAPVSRPSTEKPAENFAEKQNAPPANLVAAPISPAPTETKSTPTLTITPSTERSENRKSATPVPKGLEIDGTVALDPHKPEDEVEMIRTYLWKGRRFEVQGNEPEEWLRDVRETPKNPTAARASSIARNSVTPAPGRTRRSLHGSSSRADSRRRSTRQG